jgi:septal ring factor EnvC (AmiA/AmiB activator)
MIRAAAAAAALMLLAISPAGAAAANVAGELDAVRQECIAAAGDVQLHEQAVAALEHGGILLEREAAGRQRGLDESRVEQARLLGMIERVAREPPDRFGPGWFAGAAERPIDRIRGGLLLRTAVPALRAEARALAGEIERVATLRSEIAAKRDALAAAREALATDREHLAQLVGRRLELTRRLMPEEPGSEAQSARLGHDARDVADLIKRADAAIDRRDKELVARARATLPKAKAAALSSEAADPTRPHELRAFDPPHSVLTMPVSGTVSHRFGATDGTAAKSQGLRLAALPGGEVVAAFDGRVVYAGRFGNLGLILIMRHGGLYHTLLGVERVDVKVGQWILAGEPVGAVPDAVDTATGTLYVELRRDGRPVDPQTYMAVGDEGRDSEGENRKVRE